MHAIDSRPDDDAGRLRLQMMGDFRVVVGDREIDPSVWKLRKAAAIVKLLALDPARQLHHEQLMDLLWPDVEPESAANSLRRTLHVARRILMPDGGGSAPWLRRIGDVLSLGPRELIATDVDEFEAAVTGLRNTVDTVRYRQALDLYTGDLLPEDRYEEWAEPRRTTLRTSYLTLLARLATICEEAGQQDDAVDLLQRLIALDPAHEEAHTGLMRLFALGGQRRRALSQYQHLRDALQRELDIEPAASSKDLYQQILTGTLLDEVAPARAATQPQAAGGRTSPSPSNLPVQLTSFIGREEQVNEVVELLTRGADQPTVVTLTGTGGGGKTRLAIEVAGLARRAFPDGIWFVELAPLRDPALLSLHVLAGIPPLREEPGRSALEALLGWFSERRALLILDNCEHLVDACARLVETLAHACPQLTILATSRESLRINGETLWPVPPLNIPAHGHALTLDQLLTLDGPRLFIERARATHPHFTVSEASAPLIAEVSRKLDGLPLAIELAATRVRVLTLAEIDARLDDALRLLTEGTRTSPARQHSLRATLDWSYDLLTHEERVLLRRLSVFSGGCQLDAVEAACVGDSVQADAVLDLLSHLVDKSLVEVDESGPQARFRLLEPVRQYAAERLANAGEVELIHERHAAWWRGFAEAMLIQWRGTGEAQRTQMGRLIRELDNVRGILARALVTTGDVDLDAARREHGAHLLVGLHYFWQDGYMSEGCGWFERYLAAMDRPLTDVTCYFRMLHSLTMYSRRLGMYDLALQTGERCLAESRQFDRQTDVERALWGIGGVARDRGDYQRAIECYEAALESARERDEAWDIATNLVELADALIRAGDFPRAVEAASESVAVCRARQPGQARLAEALAELAHAQLGMGDLTAARDSAEESLAVCRGFNWLWGAALALTKLGRVAHAQDDLDWSEAAWLESLTIFQKLGELPRIAICFEGLGRLATTRGQYARAAVLFGAADTLRSTLGSPLPPSDQLALARSVATVRSVIGPEASELQRNSGRSLTSDEAIAYALQSVEV